MSLLEIPRTKPLLCLSLALDGGDVADLDVEVLDGKNCFSNSMYVWPQNFRQAVVEVRAFATAMPGTPHDMHFADEYGGQGGRFRMQLRFHRPGSIFIATTQEADECEVG